MLTSYRNARHRRGFTLVELLVVVLIIVIVSAATLPVVIPAFTHRRVSEGARLLQATLAGARDAAIRANAPRGIRLLPDPVFSSNGRLAANRMIAIEPAPDYSTGRITVLNGITPGTFPVDTFSVSNGLVTITQISVTEAVFDASGLPNEPTSWYWNIRQGDKIRFDDSGRYYTVAGPIQGGAYAGGQAYNVERYVNYGPPGRVPGPFPFPPWNLSTQALPVVSNPATMFTINQLPERLFLVNGQDDDGDGWVDEGFDGIDNDGDGVVDPGYNGLDDNGNNMIDEPAELYYNNGGEYEPEQFIGSQFTTAFISQNYTIFRRPVVSESAREVALPEGVVVDLTTWNAASAFTGSLQNPTPQPSLPERSRLPVDPYSLFVDVMIAPNGQVVPSAGGTSALNSGTRLASPTSNMPFYHFWIAEREDVHEPLWGVTNRVDPLTKTTIREVPRSNPSYTANPLPLRYLLPMPEGTTNYTPPNNTAYLKGDRRLVTLYTRTGLILSNEIHDFNGGDTNFPYYQAQFGTRETK